MANEKKDFLEILKEIDKINLPVFNFSVDIYKKKCYYYVCS